MTDLLAGAEQKFFRVGALGAGEEDEVDAAGRDGRAGPGMELNEKEVGQCFAVVAAARRLRATSMTFQRKSVGMIVAILSFCCASESR